MRPIILPLAIFAAGFSMSLPVHSQTLTKSLSELTETQGVTGYEAPVLKLIEQRLAGLHPQRDAMGNITVTFGSGAPQRLIVTPVDEPGYVISSIEGDGYARLQRLPQTGLPVHWNELNNAQPMMVEGRDGKMHSAIMSGLSIHLEPGRGDLPNVDDLDHMYLDLGARSAAEVRAAGVDVLSPVAAERHLLRIGTTQWSSTAVGDRYGVAVLLELAAAMQKSKGKGTTTLAFVTQQWAGTRGLTRVLTSMHPDELIYVGRTRQPARTASTAETKDSDTQAPASTEALGSGIVSTDVSGAAPSVESAVAREFAADGQVRAHSLVAPILVKTYGALPPLPSQAVHLSVPLLYPLTAAETLDERDVEDLLKKLEKHLGLPSSTYTEQQSIAISEPALPSKPTSHPSMNVVLKTLVEAYGVSEQERMSREAVDRMLPSWARPETDAGGNLILRLGSAATQKSSEPAGIVFMAHTDELGFRIRAIKDDGTLELDNKGGGAPAFFWGHPALVHTANGVRGGVVTLPANWESPRFKFPADFRISANLYVGASSAADVAKLGIKVGDQITIPKRYRSLMGTRVSARSLDDRVGCAAMVQAVWALGPNTKRNVTFVWSTREELGLLGAGEYATAAAAANKTPATIFAIDTFVSSDSPIESQRFADGKLGSGFVIRAVDGSNIASWPLVQRVQALAEQHKIPVQYGVTGGGNDGASFQRFGSSDVPLSWALRYSHSPGEVIDVKDADALSDVVTALAKEW